jgi:competence protein ComGC
MLIVFIIISILACLCLATIVEVVKERIQENHMVTLVTENTLKL